MGRPIAKHETRNVCSTNSFIANVASDRLTGPKPRPVATTAITAMPITNIAVPRLPRRKA